MKSVVCAMYLLAVSVVIEAVPIHDLCKYKGPSDPEHETYEELLNEELKRISSQIWDLDSNRLSAVEGFRYHVTGTKLFTKGDQVIENKLNTPTFASLRKLLNSYNTRRGCLVNEDAFLKEILKTQPIECLRVWLETNPNPVLKNLAFPETFKKKLIQSWFYRSHQDPWADCPLSGNGFSHTFFGEIKKGFHNWVQAYLQENTGSFTYKGLVEGCKLPPPVLSFHFDWRGPGKEKNSGNYNTKMSSMFLGTSPEVEIALYTLCFLVKPSPEGSDHIYCDVSLNGVDVKILAWRKKGLTTIASAYPNC